LTIDGGVDLAPGGVIMVRTADKAVVPVPPYSLYDQTAGLQPMEPIAPPGLAREATFLRAKKPDSTCNVTPDGGVPTPGPCTPLDLASSSVAAGLFDLLAAVTSTDGATYFVDVFKRRLVANYLGAQTPLISQAQLLIPSSSDPNPPTFTFLAANGAHPNLGWFTTGVTHSSNWRVLWHAPFPGLETRSGTLSSSGSGNLILQLSGTDLTPWTADPALQLAVGDTVSIQSYNVPANAPPACSTLIAAEPVSPTYPRFELPILSLSLPGTLQLAPLKSTAAERGFDLSACPGTVLGVVAAVRAAGSLPWMVFDNATVLGRMKTGDNFVGTEQRFDYPLDYTTGSVPLVSDNVAAAFQLGGDEPVNPGAGWIFSLSSATNPQSFRDQTLIQGFATAVLSYSSNRYPQLVYSSITGENAVVQADTTALFYLYYVSYK
jgi:hypothetical protein